MIDRLRSRPTVPGRTRHALGANVEGSRPAGFALGRWLTALILGATALHLVTASQLGLGNDEAYHALYASNPNLSYFDHPPMLAVVERFGLTLAGDPYSVLGLRLGFILMFAGSTWLVARITARSYGDRPALLAALALNVSGYYGLAASTFALPDGPLLFFWLLTLERLGPALDRPRSIGRWVGVGLACGGRCSASITASSSRRARCCSCSYTGRCDLSCACRGLTWRR